MRKSFSSQSETKSNDIYDKKCEIITETGLYFEDSVFDIIIKVGKPDKVDKPSKHSISLTYSKVLFDTSVYESYIFSHNKLNSVQYQTERLSANESNDFLKSVEQIIKNNTDESIICYERQNKKHWELSYGISNICICLYFQNNIGFLTIDYC